MANIMMTDVCNLSCPYCFANEYVNKDKNEITEEAFDEAVNFILGDGSHNTIGLIGGEPTLHSKFEYLLRKLIRNKQVNNIVIYTNGICLDKYWSVITHKKVHMLINCNSPSDIGEKAFIKLCENLEVLFNEKEFGDNVTLGINMYKYDFEYDYLLELLVKYCADHVRVSITVPNIESKRKVDVHDYFNKMKPRMMEFFKELLEKGIVPNFDCNKIPSCLVSDDELDELRKYIDDPNTTESVRRSNISNNMVRCSPVIDIRQDLTAVRCFGLSQWTKQNIRDFKGIKDLENYYLRTIDAHAYNTVYSSKCTDCYARKTLQCSGGCMAFKINEIIQLAEYADELNSRWE